MRYYVMSSGSDCDRANAEYDRWFQTEPEQPVLDDQPEPEIESEDKPCRTMRVN